MFSVLNIYLLGVFIETVSIAPHVHTDMVEFAYITMRLL